MRFLVLLFMLVFGVVLQSAFPAVTWLGMAKPPIVLGVVLYYAFTQSRGMVMGAAILGGLVQDAMSMVPLGYSSAFFCLAGLAVWRYRDVVFVFRSVTHAMAGALAAGVITLALALILSRQGLVVLLPGLMASQVLGASLLGVLATPLVFRFAASLDQMLGNLEEAYP